MRNTILVLVVILVGVVVVVQGMPSVAEEGSASKISAEVLALQQERIELLQKRVAYIESLIDDRSIGHSALIRPRMDLLQARIEYAETNDEKKNLLTQLMGEYDKLIDISEMLKREPPRVGDLEAQTRAKSLEGSNALWLRAERVRIQIERDSLK